MSIILCESTLDKNAKILYEDKDSISYKIENDDGEFVVTEYMVFSGIWLCYKDAHIQKFYYPCDYPEGLLEITHCHEGRFEYDAGEQFFYLSRGDMSVNISKTGGFSVFFPTQHYHGISIIIDTRQAPCCLSCFLEDVNVSPAKILEKFCKKQEYFIMRSSERSL